MNIIKDRKLITSGYVNALAKYLVENSKEFFTKENEADSWDDFCRWDKPCDRTHLVMPGEVCLIDRNYKDEHWYMICSFKKNGNVVDWMAVIKIDGLKYGEWKNGYYLLPKLSE